MLILFGGGDGGGIFIGPDGKPHRIPPWNPDLLAFLNAANYLLKAKTPETQVFAEKLTTTALPRITEKMDPMIKGAKTVAFLDGDDGFTCGSTGKKPFPFPIPHR